MNQRHLIKTAWFEFRVARQYSGDLNTLETDGRVPGWFKYFELGYDITQSPSLEYTLYNLKKINSENHEILAERAGENLAPCRTVKEAQERLRRLIRHP